MYVRMLERKQYLHSISECTTRYGFEATDAASITLMITIADTPDPCLAVTSRSAHSGEENTPRFANAEGLSSCLQIAMHFARGGSIMYIVAKFLACWLTCKRHDRTEDYV